MNDRSLTCKHIGKYEVIHLLGKGSTSIVYLAWDRFAQRQVAVKLFRQEVLQDPEKGRLYKILLLNEAALVGKLVHPHIIQIYDAVPKGAEAYVVMEYAPGGTLEQLTRPDTLPTYDRVIEIIFKCTRALDYAFRQGITHRDIKPANILLMDPEGTDIRITDFGTAIHSSSDTTQVSGVGSPAYMSPQQVREMPLDQRTDIYSLGVVMFQLLTGHLPFESENNYSLLYRIVNESAPLPSSLRPDIPVELDRIVGRAMLKDVERRYQNWDEFSHDLALAFSNRNIHDRQSFTETEKFQTLRAMPFFREFNDPELWEVINMSHWAWFNPGSVVIKEGEGSQKQFYFIARGEAKVKRNGRMLNILTTGDCFGEMSFFAAASGIRSASVETSARSSIISIRSEILEKASESCRMHFYKAFLEVVTTRLSLASARIVNN